MDTTPSNTIVSQNLLQAAIQDASKSQPFHIQIPLISIKLERDTHSLWRTTIVSSLETFELESHAIDPTPPSEFLPSTTENSNPATNPEYKIWKKRDRFVLLWLKSTLGTRMLAIVARCTSTRSSWLAIECYFQAQTRANMMSLKSQLQTMTKGSPSMLEYIEKKRSIADTLSENLHPIDDEDLISYILQGGSTSGVRPLSPSCSASAPTSTPVPQAYATARYSNNSKN